MVTPSAPGDSGCIGELKICQDVLEELQDVSGAQDGCIEELRMYQGG